MDDAIFTARDGLMEPTALARGPWDAGALHGGAPAALLGRAVEAVPAGGPMLVARITVEFLRPVPLAPLEVRAELVRPGRRVQLVAASARAAGTEVCRALALRVRQAPGAVPEVAGTEPPPRGPEEATAPDFPSWPDGPSFATDGVELRFLAGSYAPGPASAWIRLAHPLVAGEAPSALQRALAAADFGNGVSAALDWSEFLFVNPDLSLFLDREPRGEWVALQARTTVSAQGTGLAESVLLDRDGRVGRAVQSLFVERR